jgi:hypothetical protein
MLDRKKFAKAEKVYLINLSLVSLNFPDEILINDVNSRGFYSMNRHKKLDVDQNNEIDWF